MKLQLEKQTGTKAFDNIYPDLLLQFPESELNSYKHFKKIIDSGVYNLLYLRHDTINVGYILYFEYEDFIWLDYLAIFRQYQSLGYGSRVFEKLKEHFDYIKGCYLEVEKPDKKYINTVKRIEFYKRQGALKLDFKYLYPNAKGCLPMDLYFMPFKKSFMPDKNSVIKFVKFAFNTIHSDLGHINDIYEKIIILNR